MGRKENGEKKRRRNTEEGNGRGKRGGKPRQKRMRETKKGVGCLQGEELTTRNE